ncbi:MarR family winged helix-turn-helix transcriptional regulator [Enemella evansiae]|uniref:MarR family winged helix-turn-helix transcriptional regulator n=1 Tax=Enemella evansiae TaxID=2016499 RepID=UPI000B95CC0A|nr:MarR family transcriptional regulator [Enemella evansiae]OYO18844.1 MarR family transcriptional regulator [Enemella evansiae]TDO87567.1 DNA-binding MarR family transcriptional regulator [Enemella evansiae]
MDDGSDAGELGDLVRRTSRALRRITVAAAEPYGLSPHQLRALRVIAEADRPRPSDVAERLHIQARSATDVIDQLVGSGLVERTPHPEDRRASLLHCTAAGRRALTAIEAERGAATAAYFAVLEPAERTTLTQLLQRLNAEGPECPTQPAAGTEAPRWRRT